MILIFIVLSSNPIKYFNTYNRYVYNFIPPLNQIKTISRVQQTIIKNQTKIISAKANPLSPLDGI